jgi:hypothetical protein
MGTATSDFGRFVYEYTFSAPVSRAVRNRRDVLAAEIDRVCLERPGGM